MRRLEFAGVEDRVRAFDKSGNTLNLVRLCASIYFGVDYDKVSREQVKIAWKYYLRWYQK